MPYPAVSPIQTHPPKSAPSPPAGTQALLGIPPECVLAPPVRTEALAPMHITDHQPEPSPSP